MSDLAMMVSYKRQDEFDEPLPNTNVVIALMVTSYARLKLLSYLQEVGESCLYYDTDSVIHVETNGQPHIETGDFLGDMADELKDYGAGSYIREFVSGGPKNYGFIVVTPNGEERCLKVKGMRLNLRASEVVNYDTVKKSVLSYVKDGFSDSLQVKHNQILRTSDYRLVTAAAVKKYNVVYNKRILLGDFTTRPFGWRE
ncbi:MAG: hypothetical protein GY737_30855, partial [Desulfobacteraceae bacterium]|nr:hypothetical protein [Desulfobacteraceae bacterium]